MNFNFIL